MLFTSLIGLLSSGLLLTTGAAPSPTPGQELSLDILGRNVQVDLLKRGASSTVAAYRGDVSAVFCAGDALSIDKTFGYMTKTYPEFKFSAAQLSNLKPEQNNEKFWTPTTEDPAVYPNRYFFSACLETPAGQIYKDTFDLKANKDLKVMLVVIWGTFGKKSRHFDPWNFTKDGILAVSCQAMALDHKYAPIGGDPSRIDFSKSVSLAESSSEMISNMAKQGWSVKQVATPSRDRKSIERQIRSVKE